MKIKICSASSLYGNGKIKDSYIKILKDYKIKEIKYEDRGSTMYKYYIEVNDINDLFELSKKIDTELIIGAENGYFYEENEIEIYDDYIE